MTRHPYQVLIYIYRRSVVGTFEFLLLKRTEINGGWWQGITGGQEINETSEQAAIREVYEETGYRTFLKFAPLNFRYTFPFSEQHRQRWPNLYAPNVHEIHEETFAAEVSIAQGEPVIDTGEHTTYLWLKHDEVLALLDWENAREAFLHLLKFIGP